MTVPSSPAPPRDDTFLSAGGRERLARAGREVAAVIGAGVLGAIAWLVVVQEGRGRGLTDLDFARGLALSVGADGVDRQEVGSTGFYATVVLGVAFMLVFALVVPRFLRRSWWWQAAPVGAAAFLLWGLAFSPARPSGILGLEAGGISSLLVFLVGAAAFAVVGVRVYTLVSGPAWWVAKENRLEEELEELTQQQRSLELPEERREEGDVRPGA